MKKLPAKIAGITTVAVEKATGRSWVGWIELLDQAGAKSWPHAEIAQWLQKKHKVND